MTPAELAEIKGTLGRSLLLYLGDYCPVGCSHCSVDARADAPRADPEQVRRVCTAINRLREVEVVGVSGGEPLADRAALTAAVETLAPGLRLVLYTSGLPWITGKRPAWITRLLPKFEVCVLSVSSFHARALGRVDYADDVIAVLLENDVKVHLHVLAVPSELSQARELAERFRASKRVWISPIPFLLRGRAERFGLIRNQRTIATTGTCQAVTAPVVRADGSFVRCCNEQVLRDLDDPDLVERFDANSLSDVFRQHIGSELVRTLMEHGPKGFVGDTDPRRSARCDSICDACSFVRKG